MKISPLIILLVLLFSCEENKMKKKKKVTWDDARKTLKNLAAEKQRKIDVINAIKDPVKRANSGPKLHSSNKTFLKFTKEEWAELAARRNEINYYQIPIDYGIKYDEKTRSNEKEIAKKMFKNLKYEVLGDKNSYDQTRIAFWSGIKTEYGFRDRIYTLEDERNCKLKLSCYTTGTSADTGKPYSLVNNIYELWSAKIDGSDPRIILDERHINKYGLLPKRTPPVIISNDGRYVVWRYVKSDNRRPSNIIKGLKTVEDRKFGLVLHDRRSKKDYWLGSYDNLTLSVDSKRKQFLIVDISNFHLYIDFVGKKLVRSIPLNSKQVWGNPTSFRYKNELSTFGDSIFERDRNLIKVKVLKKFTTKGSGGVVSRDGRFFQLSSKEHKHLRGKIYDTVEDRVINYPRQGRMRRITSISSVDSNGSPRYGLVNSYGLNRINFNKMITEVILHGHMFGDSVFYNEKLRFSNGE